MIDLIVFRAGTNRYAIKIENVQRIIQATESTAIPNIHEFIDGMISYEDKVIKILNFRKLIDMQTYESELSTLFKEFKKDYAEWVDTLKHSLKNNEVKFTKTLDPHECELGKWIDSFTAYDDEVIEVLNELIEFHKLLYVTGATALDICKDNEDKAIDIFNTKIVNIYENTIDALDRFVNNLSLVSNSLQKFIIYDNKGFIFAIKVDSIEDIAHVQESDFINSVDDGEMSEFLELDGVLDLESVLINVIKTVKLPN